MMLQSAGLEGPTEQEKAVGWSHTPTAAGMQGLSAGMSKVTVNLHLKSCLSSDPKAGKHEDAYREFEAVFIHRLGISQLFQSHITWGICQQANPRLN